MIYTNKENDELIISCDCGCGTGLLWQAKKFDDEAEQYFLCLTEHSWYAKQTGRVKPYFKRLWNAIRGKEHYLTELVMTKYEVAEYADFLRHLTENPKNEGESP